MTNWQAVPGSNQLLHNRLWCWVHGKIPCETIFSNKNFWQYIKICFVHHFVVLLDMCPSFSNLCSYSILHGLALIIPKVWVILIIGNQKEESHCSLYMIDLHVLAWLKKSRIIPGTKNDASHFVANFGRSQCRTILCAQMQEIQEVGQSRVVGGYHYCASLSRPKSCQTMRGHQQPWSMLPSWKL